MSLAEQAGYSSPTRGGYDHGALGGSFSKPTFSMSMLNLGLVKKQREERQKRERDDLPHAGGAATTGNADVDGTRDGDAAELAAADHHARPPTERDGACRLSSTFASHSAAAGAEEEATFRFGPL